MELYQALAPAALAVDEKFYINANRGVSRAYNDFRYSGKIYPIKTYMYLHFCAPVAHEETDTPSLFFDASYDGWRCGFAVHHATNPGFAAFRAAVMKNPRPFRKIAGNLVRDERLQVLGEEYKRDHFVQVTGPEKQFLNKKRFYVCAGYPPDDRYFSPALVSEIASVWQALRPLYRYFSKAIQDDGRTAGAVK